MPHYVQLKTEEGEAILIEVEEHDLPSGVAKAGLHGASVRVIAEVQSVFEKAIQSVVRLNAETFYSAVNNLPHPPNEIEMSFGVKALGEFGNFAVCKIGGEANYSFKIAWKSTSKQTPS